MMHQFKREKIVISLVNDMHIEGLMLKKRYKHIYIFSTVVPNEIEKKIGKEYCVEYLDFFLIILPQNYDLQSILWEDFYTYYGDVYEKLVDINNNIRCIKALYSYIKKSNILDYGCGSGFSISLNKNCNLIGYEPNEKMRRQAVQRGMKVVNRHQLSLLTSGYIDAVFSSYVFHMGIKTNDIEVLHKIIRRDGIIVANYYKNINSDIVNDIFMHNGFNVKKIVGFEERFGCVYEYRKL